MFAARAASALDVQALGIMFTESRRHSNPVLGFRRRSRVIRSSPDHACNSPRRIHSVYDADEPESSDTYPRSVRSRLRKQVPGPDDPPAFLWESFKLADQTSVWDGYLKNSLIVTAMIAVFVSRKVAKGESKASKPSIADSYGITSVTVRMIAYVATLLRFVLSNQETFLPGPGNVGLPDDEKLLEDAQSAWPYRKFYHSIIDNVEVRMSAEKRKQLLKWWDERVFPATSATAITAPPPSSSFLATMHAQAQEDGEQTTE